MYDDSRTCLKKVDGALLGLLAQCCVGAVLLRGSLQLNSAQRSLAILSCITLSVLAYVMAILHALSILTQGCQCDSRTEPHPSGCMQR